MMARLERLETLLARAARAGGMYPPFVLASGNLAGDERAAADERLTLSPFGPAWTVWRDGARSAGERAFALAGVEPALAHVHLLLADLASRDGDAHAEPHPEIRAALRALRPALAQSYAQLLDRLAREFDSERERDALARGFAYSAGEAAPLLASPDELACFARGALAWHRHVPACARALLAPSELAERELEHGPDGARADLEAAAFAALECPELLTALRLRGAGVAAALSTLGRSPRLASLEVIAADLAGDAAEAGALVTLPIDTLSLSLPSTTRVPFPAWIAALPSLRSLTLRYPEGGTDGGAVDLPAALCALAQLERLDLAGIRTLPDELGRLASLRSLAIHGWHLVGLPESLAELGRLEVLRVDPVLALPGVPPGFERLRALREVRLGHLTSPDLPPALLRMPWLRRVELISARRWPAAQEEELRRALPAAHVFVAFTGGAR